MEIKAMEMAPNVREDGGITYIGLFVPDRRYQTHLFVPTFKARSPPLSLPLPFLFRL
jgi:hypothetical protein